MIVAVSYGNYPYRKALRLNCTTAKKYGAVDKVYSFKQKDIDEDFRNKNFKILSQKKGNGYWLWKPYFIKKVFNELSDGDYLIYADAGGIYYQSSVRPYIEEMEKNGQWILTWASSTKEKKYTKRDTFFYMNCDTEEYTETVQMWAGLFILKKCDKSLKFVNEWLKYASDERIITDLPNQCGLDNYEGFKNHRHDQSIFSILCKKYGITSCLNISKSDFYVYHHTKYGSILTINLSNYINSTFLIKKARKSIGNIKKLVKKLLKKYI